MSTISLFRSTENKHDVYRDKDCVTRFFESLREMKIMKIINFKNKKMKLLTKEMQESYKNAQKKNHICKQKIENRYLEDK